VFLVMTLLARNEEDIIRQNILYHLEMGVDFVIATDNLSVDGTVDILKEFEAQGVLYLIREEQDAFNQHVWVTRMAHLAQSKFNADWVIHSDADEFWWPRNGTLGDALREVPDYYSVVQAPLLNFASRLPDESEPWYRRMVYRATALPPGFGRQTLTKVCHRPLEGIQIGLGNHNVVQPVGVKAMTVSPIEILHFSRRTYAQFERKVLIGGAAVERNSDLPETTCTHWRKLSDLLKHEGLREYYEHSSLTDKLVRRSISNGRLVADYRLRDFFNAHSIN